VDARGRAAGEVDRLRSDRAAAVEFQSFLLPRSAPMLPGYDFGAYHRPAAGVGGDLHDFIRARDTRIGIVVGDASGKGTSAALLMAMTRALLHALPEEEERPDRILIELNARLQPQLRRGLFVSMTYAQLDLAEHVVTIANAGHVPTLVWRSREMMVSAHPSRGVVVGAGGPSVFDARLQTERMALEPGDRVLIVTDGVNESMAPGQREFGQQHLQKHLQANGDRSSAEFLKSLIAQIDIHRGGGDASDDLTIVTFRREPEG
jgi:phosphoserine phosphatase RsbU/P